MLPTDPPPIPIVPVPEPWISVVQTLDGRVAHQCALVLTARKIECRTHRVEGVWHLLVRERDLFEARRELAMHREENSQPPPTPPTDLQTGNGWWAVAGFLIVIWSGPWIESVFLTEPLRKIGAFDVTAFRAGAWWLAATALTLHADLAHIAANSLFGGLFGYLLGRWLGGGVGWLFTLLAAIAANMTHALIQADGFRAIGASTTVFAALGLVGIYAWLRGAFASNDRRRRFAPAFAAIAMIAMTGTSGENTDLFGHLFGFLYGCLAGFVATRLPNQGIGVSGQWLCALSAIGILLFSWSQVF